MPVPNLSLIIAAWLRIQIVELAYSYWVPRFGSAGVLIKSLLQFTRRCCYWRRGSLGSTTDHIAVPVGTSANPSSTKNHSTSG
jgi:hypothetical protein